MARPTPQPDPLVELEDYIRSLLAQRKTLVDEQIALERAGAVAHEPKVGETPSSRIGRYLNGFADALHLLPGLSNDERLWQIRQDVPAIEGAVSQLEQRRLLLHGERDAARAEALEPEWREWCRQTIVLIEHLRAMEERARGVPLGVRHRLPLSEFIGAPRSVLGVDWRSDPIHPLRKAALEAGIITPTDLAETQR